MLELLLQLLSFALFSLLLLGHGVLELLVLLGALLVLVHGLVEELEFLVEVSCTLRSQTSLLGGALHLFVVDRQVSDNLLHALLLSCRVISLGGERLLSSSFFGELESALSTSLLLGLEILLDLGGRLDFTRRSFSLGRSLRC